MGAGNKDIREQWLDYDAKHSEVTGYTLWRHIALYTGVAGHAEGL